MSGEVPEGWSSSGLGDVIRLEYGRALSASTREPGSIPVYGSNGVCGEHSVPLVPQRGIVVGRKGTAGSVTVTTGPFWPIDTTYYVVPRLDVDFDWLAAALEDARLHDLNESTGVPGLNRDKVYLQSILLPPLDEQRQIAEVLRSVDDVIAREHEVRAAAEASLEHALVAMMPEPEAACGEWTATTIGEFAIVSTGKTPSTKAPDLWGGDIPFVTPTDMDGSVRSVSAARSVTKAAMKHTKIAPANSVLFTCIASIGKLCLNQEPVAFNQQINACACRDATDAEFLYWTLRRLTPQIKALSGTTAVPIVNKTAFSSVSFAAPNADTRREIVGVLSSISEVIEASDRTMLSLTEFKRRIMSDLLSGRVRVPA